MFACTKTSWTVVLNTLKTFARHLHSSPVQVLSGIQPTGNIHLGNYFGAVKQWVDYQDELPNSLLQSNTKDHLVQTNNNRPYLPPLYQVVDMHSMTTAHDPVQLRENIFNITAVLLGCGIDPKKCIVFKQSSIPYHGHLCWILTTITTMPQLFRFPQFQEKSASFKETPLGLYLYPLLQTADILLYKGTHVPIGDDQLPHLNLAKHIAAKFNRKFNQDIFPIPDTLSPQTGAGRVKSLRMPEKKMSKSEVNSKSRIELTDSDDEIMLKIRKSVTDMISEVTYDPIQRPGVSNLIQIYSLVSGLSVEQVCRHFEGKDTLMFKLELGELLVEYLKPIRTRILKLANERDYLEKILIEGANKALLIAEQTILQVQQAIGSDIASLIRQQPTNVNRQQYTATNQQR